MQLAAGAAVQTVQTVKRERNVASPYLLRQERDNLSANSVQPLGNFRLSIKQVVTTPEETKQALRAELSGLSLARQQAPTYTKTELVRLQSLDAITRRESDAVVISGMRVAGFPAVGATNVIHVC